MGEYSQHEEVGQQTGRENVEGQELLSYESLSLPELFGGEIFSHLAV